MRLSAARRLVAALVLAHTSVAIQQAAASPTDLIATGSLAEPVMSSDARYVAWVDSYTGLNVFDRTTRDLQRYTVAEVAGPELRVGGIFEVGGISDDGRYVVLTASWSGTYLFERATVRFDRQTGTRVDLAKVSGFGQAANTLAEGLSMSRDGQTIAWLDRYSGGQPRVMLWRASNPTPQEIGTTCQGPGPYGTTRPCIKGPAVSGDGSTVLYMAGTTTPEGVAAYTVATGAKTYFPQFAAAEYQRPFSPPMRTTLDGRFTLASAAGETGPLGLLDRTTPTVDPLAELPAPLVAIGVSDDGNSVAGTTLGMEGVILDRRSGLVARHTGQQPAALSANGRYLLATQLNGALLDLVVVDLDADEDGMLDAWEKQFGLDPTNAADATADPDGDGLTNAAEFAARSHPTAVSSATRLFAEGAGGAFFDTLISVFNPGDVERNVVVRFLPPAGGGANRTLRLAAKGRADLSSCCLPALAATEFAVVVESDGPIVADRRMTWDRVTGYGSHASTGVSAPATTWYFAEGATIGGLQTFFLLQNPGAVDGIADIEYLLADGTQVTRSHPVPAGTRQTIWVNQEGAPLGAAEFAAVVRTTVPMVAERALYRDAAGQVFAAGTNAIGVTAPASRWFFAEGTTRAGFDTFVLMANPSDAPVTVTATFAGATGTGAQVSLARTYTIGPRSRLTVWADAEDPQLADADLSTTVDATAPIVAERAMWWRTNGQEWVEGHVEFGATETGTVFAIADGSTVPVGTPGVVNAPTETYVLVGVPDGTPAMLRVTAYLTGGLPVVREFTTAGQRTTIAMGQSFPEVTGSYSIVVESLPVNGIATPIVVERAIYSGGFAAGAAATAARLQ